MQGLLAFWQQGDAVTRSVALILLSMSVAAWVLIAWKLVLLRRVRRQLPRAVAAFWAASGIDAARGQLPAFDRDGVLTPLLDAAQARPAADTLDAQGDLAAQRSRRLRRALQGTAAHLRFGQVVLASVGSTAPFVGLFGTVWSIYHALAGIAAQGSLAIAQVSGPIGEALVMTAAGLAVAIPAVLAYNLFNHWIGGCSAELEGFAHDLMALPAPAATPQAAGKATP